MHQPYSQFLVSRLSATLVKACLALTLSIVVAACGQTGDLRLPEKPTPSPSPVAPSPLVSPVIEAEPTADDGESLN